MLSANVCPYNYVSIILIIEIIARAPMVLGIQITKFKFHQCLLMANSPNLMLAKPFLLYIYGILLTMYIGI